jgi:hypothetical protein
MNDDKGQSAARGWLTPVWRELALPALVALGVLLILVALIEGESAGDFLYAIF